MRLAMAEDIREVAITSVAGNVLKFTRMSCAKELGENEKSRNLC